MAYLLIIHEVEDFDGWKAAYDGHESARIVAGLSEIHLMRDTDDPRKVVLLFEAKDPAAAREFIESDDLRKKMDEAGVAGEPVFHILEEAKLRKAA